MLDTLFLQILNMSFTASYVILFVLLARLILQKSPKIFSYALWSVVLFRLSCPLSFENGFSWFSLTGRTAQQIRPFPETFTTLSDVLPLQGIGNTMQTRQPVVEAAEPLFYGIFTLIWLVGIAALLIYSVASLLKLRRGLKDAEHESSNIYTTASITSPFVMGLFRPKIYLPAHLTEEEKRYIILHEQIHIKRFDHVMKIVSFFVLCLHWFNPLVWVAFFFCGRDMELSCDEAVIKKLGSDVKKDYSSSLLTLATGRRIVGGTPLTFGEGDTKSRIKNVLHYKKPAFWVIVVSIIAVVAIGVGLAANPIEKRIEKPSVIQQQDETLLSGVYSAEKLCDATTPYIGNNVAVGKLIGLLPSPMCLQYDHFALQTSAQPYRIEIMYSVSTKMLAKYDSSDGAIADYFQKNALLLLALVDNADEVRAVLTDGNREVEFINGREWAEYIVGGDVRDYAQSPKKLQELIDFTITSSEDETAGAEYSFARIGKNGSLLSSYSLKNKELADAILFDALSKSAAWEGVDVSTLEEYYLIRQSFAEGGEIHDYYVYRIADGTPVLQNGTDGRYSTLSADLYLQLVDSFNS